MRRRREEEAVDDYEEEADGGRFFSGRKAPRVKTPPATVHTFWRP